MGGDKTECTGGASGTQDAPETPVIESEGCPAELAAVQGPDTLYVEGCARKQLGLNPVAASELVRNLAAPAIQAIEDAGRAGDVETVRRLLNDARTRN